MKYIFLAFIMLFTVATSNCMLSLYPLRDNPEECGDELLREDFPLDAASLPEKRQAPRIMEEFGWRAMEGPQSAFFGMFAAVACLALKVGGYYDSED